MFPAPMSRRRIERTWVEGVDAIGRGDEAGAAAAFEAVIALDPTQADAWLGLHAAGARRDEAIERMAEHRATFGGLRHRTGRSLRSRFLIGDYVTMALESQLQLWAAQMARLLDQKRYGEVWDAIKDARLDDDLTKFIAARWAVLAEEWAKVLRYARGIQDAFLHEEAQLYVGMALVVQHVYQEALNVLRPYPVKLDRGGDADGTFAYFKGLAYEGAGDEEAAREQFQYAFRLLPEVDFVAEKARAKVTSSGLAVAADGDGESAAAPGEVAEGDGPDRAALLSEGRKELEAMIGLAPVKDQVKKFEAQLRMEALRSGDGPDAKVAPRHLVFTGPPGTGKTTVARIVGKLLAGLGVLDGGHLVEAQRVDLVGRYLGHTAEKTNAKIDEALDGVLFIDEAYALQNEGYTGGDAFGSEAMQTILKRAEDDRHRLTIILAGYTDEIDRLLDTNPGLRSRFSTRIAFESYSAAELGEIAGAILADRGERLSPAAESALRERLEQAESEGRVDALGNGRFARELVAETLALRDLRLAEAYPDSAPSDEELRTVEESDLAGAFGQLAAGS